MRILFVLLSVATPLLADDWPHYLGPNRDNIWRETGILEKFPAGGPKVVWRAKIAGGYSGPAVVDGKVYIGDFVSSANPKQEIYKRTDYTGTERVLCYDEKTGQQLWSFEYPMRYTISFPTGPRVTPTVSDGRVYFLGAEGRFTCLDAGTGKLLWQTDYQKDYESKTPLWGFAGHPLVDGDRVFALVGGPGACVVAFDKKTGKELWRKLNAAEPGYGSPTMLEIGGRRLLIVWHAESVNALDPETGERVWNEPIKASNGSSIMVPILHGEYFFVGGYSHVCKGMRLTPDMGKPEVLWTGTRKTGVYPVNSQPIAADGHLYGVCQNGELRCVDLKTGERRWETLDPVGGRAAQCASAMLVKNGDRYFLFSDTGELIIARLTPKGYDEIDRAKVIAPTGRSAGRDVVYCAPAFANKRMYVRNDQELICVDLAAN